MCVCVYDPAWVAFFPSACVSISVSLLPGCVAAKPPWGSPQRTAKTFSIAQSRLQRTECQKKTTSNPTPSEMKRSGTKRCSEASHLCFGLLYVGEANLRRLFDESGPSADVTSSSLFSVL